MKKPDKSFTEVTVSDGHGEFMVHLDSVGNPIRMYCYADQIGHWPKDKDYDESDVSI